MEICANESNKNGRFWCRAASYKNCIGENCPFYITKQKAEESLIKANNRLNSLSSIDQKNIAGTYYGGEMPWKNNFKNF